MLDTQTRLPLSNYSDLYNIIIPKNDMWRRMADEIDYSFVRRELKDKYSENMGRTAVDPVVLFKYLMIKIIKDLSDRDLVAQVRCNMAYKYFLGMNPEDMPIDATLLSFFRRKRLKDVTMINTLISQTVEMAISRNMMPRKEIVILDSTHTKSMFAMYKPLDILKMRSRELRKSLYEKNLQAASEKIFNDHQIKDSVEEIAYCEKLLSYVKANYPVEMALTIVLEKYNMLEETLEDVQRRYTISIKDKDVRVGHKNKMTDFFGYKTHIAMTPQGMITGVVVTSGEKGDSDYAATLVDESRKNGMDIDSVLGDGAYSAQDFLKKGKEESFKIYAKLYPAITNGYRKDEERFDFNKDANCPVCPAGHIPVKEKTYIKKSKTNKEHKTLKYYFDKNICQCCALRDTCLKKGTKARIYSIALHTEEQEEQKTFQQTEEFKEKYKKRGLIEAKFGEMKHMGYDKANSYGLEAMSLQAAVSIYVTNLKKIFRIT